MKSTKVEHLTDIEVRMACMLFIEAETGQLATGQTAILIDKDTLELLEIQVHVEDD